MKVRLLCQLPTEFFRSLILFRDNGENKWFPFLLATWKPFKDPRGSLFPTAALTCYVKSLFGFNLDIFPSCWTWLWLSLCAESYKTVKTIVFVFLPPEMIPNFWLFFNLQCKEICLDNSSVTELGTVCCSFLKVSLKSQHCCSLWKRWRGSRWTQ